ncbi:unnamed protein product [Paramecium pentaurelia]|uniref:Uncharacterized protein n=1 Tax=Paramecium pentaurelia TaxID=43138 RepID=A0A8S1VY63_9CILI|nr:unnamed protein product [Paramecium pentaurelia]
MEEQVQCYEDLCISIVESQTITKSIIKQIIHESSSIIVNKHINSILPLLGYNWFREQVIVLMDEYNLRNDDFEENVIEDSEPIAVNTEHWRRCQGQVKQVTSRENSKSPVIRRSDTKRMSKLVTMKTSRQSECFNSQLIKMGELEEEQEFDPNIESIRQAKLRQISIQQQKEQNDKIKILEVQEQVKQLKRLNVDSKSKYTFDYEGKVVVQKPPDIDRYPKSFQNISEKRSLVEVRDLIPNHKMQSELIQLTSKNNQNIGQNNQFAIKTSVPQIDLIIMKEGVTFNDGKQEKKKDRLLPLMDIKDPIQLQQTLQKQNVQMTKIEYQQITSTSSNNNTFQNKTMSLSSYQQQQQQNQYTNRSQQQNDNLLNMNDSLLSQRVPKHLTTMNHSISSSILQKLNGSISILSEQQIEELLVPQTEGNKDSKEHPLFLKRKKTESEVKPSKSVPTLTFELPQIPPNILSNTLSKLPKTFQSQGTFPKLIPKFPRQRISKQAIQLKIES